MTTTLAKLAVITGASKGIGRAVAITLARSGFSVVLVGRSVAGLQETQRKLDRESLVGWSCRADVSTASGRHRVASLVGRKGGHLNILVNCASGFLTKSLRRTSDSEIVELFRPVTGTIALTRELLPFLASGRGLVVNLCSDWALPGSKGPAVFSAAKWAMSGLGRSLVYEPGCSLVRVTNLYPGDVASEFDIDDPETKVTSKYGRMKTPVRTIASLVQFMLEHDEARFPDVTVLPRDSRYGGH